MGNFSVVSIFLLVLLSLIGCTTPQKVSASPQPTPSSLVTRVGFDTSLPKIVDPTPDKIVAHNSESFTQGLVYSQGKLYESGGRYQMSSLQRVSTDSGEVEESQAVGGEFFAEGLTELDGKLYLLTWQEGICLIYERDSLKKIGQLFYNGEGWGLTVSPQDKLLVMSSGNDILQYLTPSSFAPRKQIQVTDENGLGVPQLNELEWVRGEIWANVWMTDRIARIDPESGKILGWIVLSKICKDNQVDFESVLNGIAYDPKTDTLAVTGKLWTKLYLFDNVQETFFK